MLEKASLENILEAGRLFKKLPCPVYCTPGNHDLTEEDSVKNWLSKTPELFNAKSIDFSFCRDNVRFDFISCHWGKKAYFWHSDEVQIPYLQADKISFNTNYNFNKTYIQGRTCDRSFKEILK